MSEHAKLSASGASRWMNCPGSIRIEAELPDTTSSAAEEGTLAHALAEAILTNKKPPEHPEDMRTYVQEYVDYINTFIEPPLIEQRVSFNEWVPDGFGTADAIILDDDHCHVIDLKYGKGVKVFADTPQGKLYRLGVLQEYGFEYGIKEMTFHIVQPRLDHIDTHSMTTKELLEWGNDVKRCAQLALSDDAPVIPGEKQCQFCKARFTCRERAIHALQESNKPTIDQSEIADLIEIAGLVEQWAKDIKSKAFELAEAGVTLPGYKLVAGRSIRQLTNSAPDILREHGVEPYEQKLKTLTTIEKELGGKRKANPILDTCTTKPEGKPTLVKSSDPRPPITAGTVDSFPIGE